MLVPATMATSGGGEAAVRASMTMSQASRSRPTSGTGTQRAPRVHRLHHRIERRVRRIAEQRVPAECIGFVERVAVLEPQANAIVRHRDRADGRVARDECGMDAQDRGDRLAVVAGDAECATEPPCRHRAGADPLGGSDLPRDVVASPIGHRQHQRAHEEVVLHEELLAHAYQRSA